MEVEPHYTLPTRFTRCTRFTLLTWFTVLHCWHGQCTVDLGLQCWHGLHCWHSVHCWHGLHCSHGLHYWHGLHYIHGFVIKGRDHVIITAPNECVCDVLLKPCLCPWLCSKTRDFLCAWLMSCAQKIKAMVVRMAVTMRKFSVRMALSTRTENQG